MEEVSRTLDTPNNVFTSMMPMPRSSIKCLVISGAEPIRVSPLTFRISTTSSDTRRCPLLISSSAASDFPIPLSPVIRSPSPYTSQRTPWIRMQGARRTFSHRITSAITWEVGCGVINSGTFALVAKSMKLWSGCRFLQKTMQGIPLSRSFWK